MIIVNKVVISLLLLTFIGIVLYLLFLENDKARKILGIIVIGEIITFIISLFVLIWIT